MFEDLDLGFDVGGIDIEDVNLSESANLRSSGNIEQFTMEDNEELYNFYDEVFGSILERYRTINKQLRGNELWDVMNNKK